MKLNYGYAIYFSFNGEYPATITCSDANSVYARLRYIMSIEPCDCTCMRVIVYLPYTHMDIRLWQDDYTWRIDSNDFKVLTHVPLVEAEDFYYDLLSDIDE